MEAEDLLDKFAQHEGFGNWDTVVLNCHHSVIRSVAIAAVNQALRQPHVSGELADFVQFLADEYSMKVPERVIDEWEKYYSANYR